MQIQIPTHAESLVKNRAARAGFDDVADYLLSLVGRDARNQLADLSIDGPDGDELVASYWKRWSESNAE
jgi:hypothetical protein